ncbi:MAG: TolA protein [Ignavibacteriae bacterium]|nr:MAG: TolA protein [Ignavibacteriota bacterium]
MEDNGSFKITDELKKRAEELAKKVEADEILRIEELIKKAEEFASMRNRDFWEKCEAKLKLAEQIFQQSKQDLIEREREIEQILKEERVKKLDAYKKQLEEKKLREEEERRRLEEEKRRQEEEQQRRLEEERRLKEELQRKREEEERLRREEEERRKKEEIELKVQTLLTQAREYFENNNYEAALIEVAKALVHNPEHPEAIELKQSIKQAQTATTQVTEQEEKEKAVETVEFDKIETIPETKPIAPASPVKKRKKYPIVAIAVAIIALIAIALYQYLPRIFYQSPSIAVLPFKSETGTLEEDVLGRGISEDIVNRLYYIKDLKIMGYKSALFISNSYSNPENLVYQTGFGKILEGRIKQTDNQISVKIILKDTAGNNIEKEILENKEKLFELPSVVCKEIVNMLNIDKENVNETAFRISTSDNSAYLMYLRGLEMMHRQTEASLNNAQQLFDYATSLDDSFVESFAMSGYASLLKNVYYYRSNKDFSKASDMLERADIKMLNPLFVKPKIMLLNIYKKDFSSAINIHNKLESTFYKNAEIYKCDGILKLFTGNYENATDVLILAKELDPYDFELLRLISKAYQLNKEYKSAYSLYNQYSAFFDDTSSAVMNDLSNIILNDPELMVKYSNRLIGILEKRIERNPKDCRDRYKLARIYQVNGKYSDAEPILIKALDLNEGEYLTKPNNPEVLIYRALINTRLGRFNDAVKNAQAALQMANDDYRIYYKAAQMYAIQAKGNDTLYYDKKTKRPILKEFIKSIELLQQGVEKYFDIDEILDVDFYNLRRTVEFQEAIKLKGK